MGEQLRENLVAEAIVDSAVKIHRCLGPGLFESTYELCLEHELKMRGFHVERQKHLSLVYEDLVVENAYKLDMLVDDCVLVELKVVEAVLALHEAQLLTYLRLSGKKLGLLLDFNSRLMKDGIKRMVHRL